MPVHGGTQPVVGPELGGGTAVPAVTGELQAVSNDDEATFALTGERERILGSATEA